MRVRFLSGWLKILPIGNEHIEYAREVAAKLEDAGLRTSVDERNEKIGYKIREAQLQKLPYMLVVGEKEVEEKLVAVRRRGEGDLGQMNVEDFIARATKEVKDLVLN